MLEPTTEFSASSNGDKWLLRQDFSTGERIVIHRGNAASGGTETSWTISRFLEIFGEHPQGNALREIVHALNDKKEAPVEGLQTMSFPSRSDEFVTDSWPEALAARRRTGAGSSCARPDLP